MKIPAPLKLELERIGFGEIPPDYFITGNQKELSVNTLGNWHREITRRLGMGPECTLYSWKHTGVVKTYQRGIDIKSIQKQCRHSGIEITDRYLRNLGLFENKEIEDNFPEL